MQVVKDKEEKDYLVIYDIITKSKQPNGNLVKDEFYKRRPNGSFEVSIQYLYEKLVETLLTLRKKKDVYYDLLNNLCKARMLYERSLFEECFEILSDTIKQAQFYENNEILTLALKLELEYLLRLNFPNMTEQELFHKHFIQNEALKKIRKITEQSSLHNLLKYRLSHIGNSVWITSAFILLIVIMGLIGYVNDETQRRSKEIAIRKVNGAEASHILGLLTRDILYVSVISILVGTTVSYFAGQAWLDQFAEQIDLNPLLFAATALFVQLLIVICVVLKAWHIANENPVNSIKAE